jgi:hypothetical protein
VTQRVFETKILIRGSENIGKIGKVFRLVAEMTLTVVGMRSRIRAKLLKLLGAGEGNRTLVFSLEGCCSTIELHPRAADQLSRQAGRLNRHERIWPARSALQATLVPSPSFAPGGALNTGRFDAYTEASINNERR